MRRPRKRNRVVEKWIAQRQARMMGMYQESDIKTVLDAIDAKQGDYYRSSLNPNQELVKAAETDFDSFRITPTMEELGRDMARYYGIGPTKALPLEATPPIKRAAVVQEAVPAKKAQALKDETVKEVIKENPEVIEDMTVQLMEEDIKRSDDAIRQTINELEQGKDDELDNLLLIGGSLGALGLGMGVGNATKEEQELTPEQYTLLKEAGMI